MAFIKVIRERGLLAAVGNELNKIPFIGTVVGVAGSFYPAVKDAATAIGVTGVSVAAVGNTVEEKIVGLASAGVAYIVHKLFYLIKDYADNKKLDGSVK